MQQEQVSNDCLFISFTLRSWPPREFPGRGKIISEAPMTPWFSNKKRKTGRQYSKALRIPLNEALNALHYARRVTRFRITSIKWGDWVNQAYYLHIKRITEDRPLKNPTCFRLDSCSFTKKTTIESKNYHMWGSSRVKIDKDKYLT